MENKCKETRKLIFLITISLFLSICTPCMDERTVNELINYGKFYYKMERYDKAVSYFEKVLEIDNFNYISMDYLSKIAAVSDYIPEITEKPIPPVKNRTGDAYQWFINGTIQFEKKAYDEAAYAFIKAYELAPEEEAYKIYTYKAKRLYELDLYKKEKEAFLKSDSPDLDRIAEDFLENKKRSSDDSRQWYLKAKFNYNMGNINQAFKELKIALILNSENSQAKELLEVMEEKQSPVEIPESDREDTHEIEIPELPVIEPVFSDPVKNTETVILKNEDTEEINISVPEKKPKSSLKIISTRDKITLNDHLTKDRQLLAGLYELPEEGEQTLKFIKERFAEAELLLKEKKFNMASEKMEEAYLKALDYNNKDLRALFYLYLISEKRHDVEKMKKYFFSMIDIIKDKNFRQEHYYIKSKELVDSLLFSMIIQGAYNAWILRNENSKFKIDSLIHEGYLSYVEKIDLDIGFNNIGKIRWKFSHIHDKNHFKIENKTVISDIYGVSPLLADEFYISEE